MLRMMLVALLGLDQEHPWLWVRAFAGTAAECEGGHAASRIFEIHFTQLIQHRAPSQSRGAMRPSDAAVVSLSFLRGRREGRAPTAPMVRVQQKSTRQNHRYEPNIRPSLRDGFNAYT
jgi:hypothetical protein